MGVARRRFFLLPIGAFQGQKPHAKKQMRSGLFLEHFFPLNPDPTGSIKTQETRSHCVLQQVIAALCFVKCLINNGNMTTVFHD